LKASFQSARRKASPVALVGVKIYKKSSLPLESEEKGIVSVLLLPPAQPVLPQRAIHVNNLDNSHLSIPI
jgi:hypothetical protein